MSNKPTTVLGAAVSLTTLAICLAGVAMAALGAQWALGNGWGLLVGGLLFTFHRKW